MPLGVCRGVDDSLPTPKTGWLSEATGGGGPLGLGYPGVARGALLVGRGFTGQPDLSQTRWPLDLFGHSDDEVFGDRLAALGAEVGVSTQDVQFGM